MLCLHVTHYTRNSHFVIPFTVLLCASYQVANSASVRWKRQQSGFQFPTAIDNQPTQSSRPSPSTTASGTTTTTASPQFRSCFSNCRTTPEYNPVCGSNGITYDSPGRLSCARRCGISKCKLQIDLIYFR